MAREVSFEDFEIVEDFEMVNPRDAEPSDMQLSEQDGFMLVDQEKKKQVIDAQEANKKPAANVERGKKDPDGFIEKVEKRKAKSLLKIEPDEMEDLLSKPTIENIMNAKTPKDNIKDIINNKSNESNELWQKKVEQQQDMPLIGMGFPDLC